MSFSTPSPGPGGLVLLDPGPRQVPGTPMAAVPTVQLNESWTLSTPLPPHIKGPSCPSSAQQVPRCTCLCFQDDPLLVTTGLSARRVPATPAAAAVTPEANPSAAESSGWTRIRSGGANTAMKPDTPGQVVPGTQRASATDEFVRSLQVRRQDPSRHKNTNSSAVLF